MIIKHIPLVVSIVISPVNAKNENIFTKVSSTISQIFKPKNPLENKSKYTKFRARITYYSPHENDGYGWKNAHPKVKKSKEGVTVAAHKNVKFGTVYIIPELDGKVGNGEFIVQDRGGAVNSKKASRGKAPVIDVFVTNNKKRDNHARYRPMYMDVYMKKK